MNQSNTAIVSEARTKQSAKIGQIAALTSLARNDGVGWADCRTHYVRLFVDDESIASGLHNLFFSVVDRLKKSILFRKSTSHQEHSFR